MDRMEGIASVQNGQSDSRERSNEKYSQARIVEALRVSRGMIATAARLLGCARQTIYDAIVRHPEINAVVAGERELLLDQAELKLQEAIDRGEAWAVKFFLLTQGQARGYIERPRADPADKQVRVVIFRDFGNGPSAEASKAIPTQPAIEHRGIPEDPL